MIMRLSSLSASKIQLRSWSLWRKRKKKKKLRRVKEQTWNRN